MLADRYLIWRFKHGSAAAFEEIYTRSKNELLKLAVVLAAGVGVYEIGGSQPAFANVIKPMLTARTAVYTIIATVPDKPRFKVRGSSWSPA